MNHGKQQEDRRRLRHHPKENRNEKRKDYTCWEARYTIGYDPGTGKQIQKSITGKTQSEVAKKLKEVTAALDAGTYIAPNKTTVAQWMDTWQAEYLGAVKPSAISSYEATSKNHIKPCLGSTKLESLTTQDIQEFYNARLKGDETRDPLLPKPSRTSTESCTRLSSRQCSTD